MDTIYPIITKIADLLLTASNIYVMIAISRLQNNKKFTDAVKEENRELKKENVYLTHKLRVAKIKARTSRMS